MWQDYVASVQEQMSHLAGQASAMALLKVSCDLVAKVIIKVYLHITPIKGLLAFTY